jgi:hypothetical protein
MKRIIDPYTNEGFIPRRKNQKFASARNRKQYHNDEATNINRLKAPIDKKLRTNFLLLLELMIDLDNVTIEKEKLLMSGFDPNYFTHLKYHEGKTSRCIYNFILPTMDNTNIINIIKSKND